MICNFYSKVGIALPFKQKEIAKVINSVAANLKIRKNYEITVLAVGDQQIKKINKKFKRQNKITDVLTFSQQEGQPIILPKAESNYLGDIIICYPQIKRQAKQFGQSVKKEFYLILIHGFLHLLGYQDETQKDYLIMKKMQEKLLTNFYD